VDATDSRREQALAVFHPAAEEIRFFMKQQWQVTNYALLTYGALVAAPELIGGSKDVANSLYVAANWVGVVVAWLALIGAVWVLLSLDRSQEKELFRMAVARWKLPMVHEIHARFRFRAGTRGYRPGRLILLLGLVLLMGALLVSGINYSRVVPPEPSLTRPETFQGACATGHGPGRLAEQGIARERILHTAESLYHDHLPAKHLGLATCWIHRRAGRSGHGATRPPEVDVRPDFRFATLGEMADAHRAEPHEGSPTKR
jgi:hypothetical protein